MGRVKMNCWFCSVREAEAQHRVGMDMHGEVDAQNMQSQTKVAYSVRHIEIPRCADCHSRHRLAKFAQFMGAVFAVVLLAGVIVALFNLLAPYIAGLWAGLALGLVIASLAAGSVAHKGIYSLRDSRAKFPAVKELLNKCYRFGARPRALIPKSDPPCNRSDNKEV